MNQAKFSSFHSYSKLSATYTHSLLNNLTPSSSNENITKKCTYETNPIHKNNYLRQKNILSPTGHKRQRRDLF